MWSNERGSLDALRSLRSFYALRHFTHRAFPLPLRTGPEYIATTLH
jgi:hypothetical protein